MGMIKHGRGKVQDIRIPDKSTKTGSQEPTTKSIREFEPKKPGEKDAK